MIESKQKQANPNKTKQTNKTVEEKKEEKKENDPEFVKKKEELNKVEEKEKAKATTAVIAKPELKKTESVAKVMHINIYFKKCSARRQQHLLLSQTQLKKTESVAKVMNYETTENFVNT
jgi:hypothetical protein